MNKVNINQRRDYKILISHTKFSPPLNLHIYIILSLCGPIVALVLQMSSPFLAHLSLSLLRSTTAPSVTHHPVSGISFPRNFACLQTTKTYLIWSHTCQFVISFVTTVTIHYFFSLSLQAQNSSFSPIVSSIVLYPFHPPDWLHGLQLAFVFLGHVGVNVGTVCLAKLASSRL